jgi:hypothetical protein
MHEVHLALIAAVVALIIAARRQPRLPGWRLEWNEISARHVWAEHLHIGASVNGGLHLYVEKTDGKTEIEFPYDVSPGEIWPGRRMMHPTAGSQRPRQLSRRTELTDAAAQAGRLVRRPRAHPIEPAIMLDERETARAAMKFEPAQFADLNRLVLSGPLFLVHKRTILRPPIDFAVA